MQIFISNSVVPINTPDLIQGDMLEVHSIDDVILNPPQLGVIIKAARVYKDTTTDSVVLCLTLMPECKSIRLLSITNLSGRILKPEESVCIQNDNYKNYTQ